MIISPLDQERGQMGQKLLIRTKPLNQPNQKLELYALDVQKLNDQDHLIQLYGRDTKANP